MISLFFPVLSSIFLCFLNLQEEIPGITEMDMPGVEIESTRTFPGDALWGYIDGGADIYLEYGFDMLKTQKIIFSGKKFIIDIYKMKDSQAAFGIFSVSHSTSCKQLESFPYSCIAPYQIQVVKGPFYISVINETNSVGEQDFAIKLTKTLIDKCQGSDFKIPAFFKQEILRNSVDLLKFMRGRLGIENGYPMWAGYFKGLKNFELIFLSENKDNQNINVGQIQLNTRNQTGIFLKNLNMDLSEYPGASSFSGDQKKWLKRKGETSFILIETMGDPPGIKTFINDLTY